MHTEKSKNKSALGLQAFLLTSLLAQGAIACDSGKNEKSSAHPKEATHKEKLSASLTGLKTHLPLSAAGYAYADFSSKGTFEISNQMSAQLSSLQDESSEVPEGTISLSALSTPFLSKVLFTDKTLKKKNFRQVLAFLDKEISDTPKAAAVFEGKDDLMKRFKGIIESYDKKAVTIQEDDNVYRVSGTIAFKEETQSQALPPGTREEDSAEEKEEEPKFLKKPFTFFVTGKDTLLSIGSTKESVVSLLSSRGQEKGISHTEGYKEAMHHITVEGNKALEFFLDIAAIEKSNEEKKEQSEELKEALKSLNGLPVKYIVGAGAVNTIQHSQFTAGLEVSGDENLSKIMEILSGGNTSHVPTYIPVDTGAMLVLKEGLVKALATAAEEFTPPAPQKEKMLKILSNISHLAIGLSSSVGQMGIPEVYFTLPAQDTTALFQAVKQLLSDTAGSYGFPATWSPLEIEGYKAEAIITPFVQIVLGSTKKFVVLSTGQSVLETLNSNIEKNSLKKEIDLSVGDKVSGNVFAAAFADGKKLSAVLEKVVGPIAMFSGGQTPEGLTESIEQLKTMESSLLYTTAKKDALSVHVLTY